jgi:hypothetical protein
MTDPDVLLADAATTTANIRRRAAQQAALDLQRDADAGTIDDPAAGLSARRIASLLADAGMLDDIAHKLTTGRAILTTAAEPFGGPAPAAHPDPSGETPMAGKPDATTAPAGDLVEDPITGSLPEDEPDDPETALAPK